MTRFMLTPFNAFPNLFDDFMNLDLSGAYPPINMYEKDNNLIIEVELSGFDPKDIQLNIVDGNLVLKGKKSINKENKDKRFFIREIVDRSFERVIPLPSDIEAGKAKADYEKGMLKITLPKKAVVEKKNLIPIRIK